MGRSKLQRGLALVLTAGLVLTSMPETARAAVKSAYTIGVGKSVTVPVNARITRISVKNKKVATVTKTSRKKFRITGVKPGKTTVTVKYGSKKPKKINVTVGTTSIQKKTFQTTWKVGQTLPVSVSAKNGADDTLLWVSSDDAVISISKESSKVSSAQVASNYLTAHNVGKATITVKSKYTSKKLQIPVRVQMAAKPTSVPVITPGIPSTVQPTTTPQATAQASEIPAQTLDVASPGVVTPDVSAVPATDVPKDSENTQPPQTTKDPQATKVPAVPATTGAINIRTNVYGATLVVTPASGSGIAPVTLSEEQNGFLFPVLPNGTYTVVAQKDGYLSDTRHVVVNGDTVQLDLELQKQEVLFVKSVHSTSLYRIQVDFSQTLDKVDQSCFSIEGVSVYTANLSNDRSSVILATSKLTEGRSYVLHVSDKLAGNNMTMASGDHSFMAKEVKYGLKMWLENNTTELVASPDASVNVYTSVYDEDGYIIKDLAGVQITYKTTAGSFAQPTLYSNADYIVNTFTSQEAEDRVDAYITATITSAANTGLIDLSASRTVVLNPTGDTGETGIYLNDVSIDSGDRMILYFNKEVNVTDYTQNCENLNDIYGYDEDKLQIVVQDAGSNYDLKHIPNGSLGNRSVYALTPVEGNKKALCAYLNLKGSSAPFTNHARVVVKVTDRTQRYELSSTKYTTVNDISSPYITKVENVSLRTLRITFSEAVQGAENAFGAMKADSVHHWTIDDVSLSDNRYGYNSFYTSTMSVGKFNKKTGEDHRNEVTLTLGKNVSGDQIYFTQGIHRIACQNIGDWCNVTSTDTNFCKAQQVDFSVSDNQEPLAATVKVYSPEQYLVTFDRVVDVNVIKSKLKLQEYNGQSWIDTNRNSITITPILENELDTETQFFMVEVDTDWTVAFQTSTSHKNYYNTDFRLHLNGGEILNVENGLLNKEINLLLDDEKMTTLDTTSPTIEKVQQYGSLIYVTMSEPVQVPGVTEETPSENVSNTGVSAPIVTFISPDNKQTIPGTIVSMVDAYDMTFSVVPSAQLTAGTWKISIASIEDDTGNTSQTLTVDEFKVNTTIEAEAGFQVLWVLAVPRGKTDPLFNATNGTSNDRIYVKFSQCFKTYGNATNATDTINYSLNNSTWPNAVTISSSVNSYNSAANIQNNYTDLILIEVEGPTLTADSNTLTISSTIESIYGDRLGNSGLKMLEKRMTNAATDDYYFAYNYKTAAAGDITSVRKLIQYCNDKEYVSVNYDRITDNEQNQIAKNTTLHISRSGTFDLTADYSASGRNTFKALDISSTESGTIRIKNACFQTVNINAPNAEVIFDNVQIDKMNVIDVLDGTLHLNSGTTCVTMEITDYSNGCKVEVDNNSSGVNSVTVNTIGNVTLGLNSGADVILAKPAKVTFTKTIHTLTLAPTAEGAQIISDGGNPIYTTLNDQTASDSLDTAISYVNDSFTSFEAGLGLSDTLEFTVTKQSSVKMSVSVPKDVIGLTFTGNKLTYTYNEGSQLFEIKVTATCTLNHTVYTASKTYRLVGSATDLAIQQP